MRQLLAVAFLGTTLAFGATAALAGENREPQFPPPAASVSIVSQPSANVSLVAGGDEPTSVYPQLADDNWGHREQ